MGGSRLLCPRPQSHRLCPRGRGARRLSRDRGGAPPTAWAGRLYRGGGSGDRVRPGFDPDRYQRRAGRGPPRRPDRPKDDSRSGATTHPEGRGRRFRAGADGPWRDDLSAAQSLMPRLPAPRRVRRLRDRQSRGFSAEGRQEGTPSPSRHRLMARTRRRHLSRPPSRQGHARRDGRASRRRMERKFASRFGAGQRRSRLLALQPEPPHSLRAGAPNGEGWWHPLDRIADAGLPTLYRKAVDAVLAER